MRASSTCFHPARKDTKSMPLRSSAIRKDGCCMPKVTRPTDIHVVPDTPTQATFTVTLAELAIFYRAGYADCAADMAGP
jgi:hypothetical protein